MYFVDNEPFDNFLDAVQRCKNNQSKITDSCGVVLMYHQKVPQSVALDIEFAKEVLNLQLKKLHEAN